MGRTTLAVLVLAGCLLVAAVVPALAGSGNNPQWVVNGTQLGMSETRELVGKGTGTQKLQTTGMTVLCTADKLEGATIVGGAGALAGSGSETLVFTGCYVRTSGGEESPTCKVNSVGDPNGTIKTSELKSLLAYESAEAAEKETPNKTLTVLKPGIGEKFTQIELSGEPCPAPGKGKYNVEGELLAHNVEGGTHGTQHTLEAPTPVIKHYWVNTGGSPKEEAPTNLKVSGTAGAIYTGSTTVELASHQEWWVTP